MGAELRAPLKPPNTIMPRCLVGFRSEKRQSPSRAAVRPMAVVYFSSQAFILYTQRIFFRYLFKSIRNKIVFTIFRLIWSQTDVRLVPNQSVHGTFCVAGGRSAGVCNGLLRMLRVATLRADLRLRRRWEYLSFLIFIVGFLYPISDGNKFIFLSLSWVFFILSWMGISSLTVSKLYWNYSFDLI